ncbi:ABC transporter permease [candidate division KSB3 bacterium]|uniref:ABC transporter permease n=1 Tax=candidate division KSB3 bacterium TaxID=2044937 RepID=A0A2G6E7Z6_9BACT|nr:MAG: ABC transporter permease [candidate division KSB3 bacterium]PIE30517.1 MAG: ABC transporter permease [candidate division KSB3 bacterium]
MEIYTRLLGYTKLYRSKILISVICSLIVGGSTAVSAMIVKDVVDTIFMNKDRVMLAYMPFIILALIAIKGLASFGQVYSIETVGQRVILRIRNELYQQLHRLSLSFFSAHQTGTLVSRITNDVQLLQTAAANLISEAIRQGFTAAGLLCVVFYRHWKLALIALLVLPVAMGIVTFFGRKMRRTSHSLQGKMAKINDLLYEKISGIRIVKAFDAGQIETERFSQVLNGYFRSALRVVRINAVNSSLSEALGGIGVAGVVWYGGYEVINGITTPGTFFSFITALLMLYEPLKRLSKFNIKLQQALAAAERVFQILDTKPVIKEKAYARELPIVKDCIRYEQVSFQYEDTPVLQDVSFTAQVGHVTAFVGLSGAGKSTLLSLLPRFYDPSEGRITLDGIDTRDVTFRSLRRQLGIVTQEVILFHDTVASNIAYGVKDCPMGRIIQAAKIANAHEYIQKLPQGYDTPIGERGTRLSGGQRQRLAIARAILKNPPIIILDEATSSLDSESEKLVQDAIANLMKERTTLVIAHRLSTIRKADRIIVLDRGRLIESGTHHELLTKGGVYARLYETQMLPGNEERGMPGD